MAMLGAIEGGHPFRQDPHPIVSNPCLCDSECSGSDSQMRKFESRMPIPYALETRNGKLDVAVMDYSFPLLFEVTCHPPPTWAFTEFYRALLA